MNEQEQDQAAVAADELKATKSLPLFRGSSKDTISTSAWCATVDRQMDQLKWTEERTASAAVDCFREVAAEWFEVMTIEEPQAIKRWDTFKTLILERFDSHRTPAQKVTMLSALAQRQSENVIDYYDRCAKTYYQVLRDSLKKVGGPNKADAIRGFNIARDDLLLFSYVTGMRPLIRKVVGQRMENDSTVKDVKKLAKATEITEGELAGKKMGYAAAMLAAEDTAEVRDRQREDADMQQLRAEIAAMRTALSGGATGARPKTFGGGGNYGTTDPAAPRQARETEGTRKLGPMRERGWLFCRRCCTWGLHIKAECTWSLNKIKATPKEDERVKPTGRPLTGSTQTPRGGPGIPSPATTAPRGNQLADADRIAAMDEDKTQDQRRRKKTMQANSGWL